MFEENVLKLWNAKTFDPACDLELSEIWSACWNISCHEFFYSDAFAW
jgi:hypothetical protein